MRTRLCFVLSLAAGLALAGSRPAHAEVIDFDPRADEVPTILSPEELERYAALIDTKSVGLASVASPNGRYILTYLADTYQILDIPARTFRPVPADNWAGLTPWLWLDDQRALAVALDFTSGGYVKLTLDAGTGQLTPEPLPLPQPPPGKRIQPFGGPLLKKADGSLHLLAYTQTVAQPLFEFERPTMRGADPLAPQALIWPRPRSEVVWTAQTQEEILAIALADGTPTRVTAVPAGYDLYLSLSTMRSQPGTSQVAYLAAASLPWAGDRVGGRPYRGGGMPLSYWNTREALGRIDPAANRWITERSLELVDLDRGQQRSIANADVGSPTAPAPKFTSLFWSDDGRRLVVRAAEPSMLAGRAHPVYEYTSGVRFLAFDPSGEYLGDLEWNVPYYGGPATSLTPIGGSRLALTVAENLWRSLYVVDLRDEGRLAQPVHRGPRVIAAAAFAGDRLVYTMLDVTQPPELYVGDVADLEGTSQRLSDVNAIPRQASHIRFAPVTYQTSHGYEVTGIYVYPDAEPFPPPQPRPVVVWQEGGPGGQMFNEWGVNVENPYSLLPNFGIPVFLVNASGRVSNGAQFYSDMADGTNYGQRDIADVKEGIEHLIAQGIVDRRSVGVTGCSYGGYFTLQSLVTYPDLYAAGNSQCTFSDLLYEWNFGWSPLLGYLMGQSATGDPDEFVRDSPAYQVQRVRSPLLLFHGTEDFLPYELITNIHDQVAANGTPVRFLRAVGYGHGLAESEGDPEGALGQRFAAQLQVDWFRRYLAPSQAALAGWFALPAFEGWPADPFRREGTR